MSQFSNLVKVGKATHKASVIKTQSVSKDTVRRIDQGRRPGSPTPQDKTRAAQKAAAWATDQQASASLHPRAVMANLRGCGYQDCSTTLLR